MYRKQYRALNISHIAFVNVFWGRKCFIFVDQLISYQGYILTRFKTGSVNREAEVGLDVFAAYDERRTAHFVNELGVTLKLCL